MPSKSATNLGAPKLFLVSKINSVLTMNSTHLFGSHGYQYLSRYGRSTATKPLFSPDFEEESDPLSPSLVRILTQLHRFVNQSPDSCSTPDKCLVILRNLLKNFKDSHPSFFKCTSGTIDFPIELDSAVWYAPSSAVQGGVSDEHRDALMIVRSFIGVSPLPSFLHLRMNEDTKRSFEKLVSALTTHGLRQSAVHKSRTTTSRPTKRGSSVKSRASSKKGKK